MKNLSSTLNNDWKNNYSIIFNNTPKKLRRTKSQIINIKSQAKLYVNLYCSYENY